MFNARGLLHGRGPSQDLLHSGASGERGKVLPYTAEDAGHQLRSNGHSRQHAAVLEVAHSRPTTQRRVLTRKPRCRMTGAMTQHLPTVLSEQPAEEVPKYQQQPSIPGIHHTLCVMPTSPGTAHTRATQPRVPHST